MMEGQPASPASVSSSAHRGEVTFRVHMVQTLVALGHHGSAICLMGVEGEEMHLASDSWRRIWGATLKPYNPGELCGGGSQPWGPRGLVAFLLTRKLPCSLGLFYSQAALPWDLPTNALKSHPDRESHGRTSLRRPMPIASQVWVWGQQEGRC